MARISVAGHYHDADLVIFDKDGTLIDFTGTWVEIVRLLMDTMARYVPMTEDLGRMVQDTLGVEIAPRTVDGTGALAMGTFSECETLLTYCIHKAGRRWDEAQEVVRILDEEVFQSDRRNACIRPATGALALLRRLKERGLAVALATNDKTKDALSDMIAIGAAAYIDVVVGADAVQNPKPAPDMIERICDHLGIPAGSAILVGDTVMDARLGRNARVALTVGVPGIVTRRELEGHMDVVVDSLDQIA